LLTAKFAFMFQKPERGSVFPRLLKMQKPQKQHQSYLFRDQTLESSQ